MSEEVKHIVRIKNTNLEGSKKVDHGLTGIKGIGFRTAQAIAEISGVDQQKRLGELSEEEVNNLEQAVDELQEEAPGWFLNRTKDVETGEDEYLTGSDVVVIRKQDIDRMKKISSYKGVRHKRGQKVRGQKTRSTGRTDSTVGVKRAELKKAAEEEKEEEE
ncbi:MAG: Ribosomal protein S13 [Candidatus Methanohalarchaeum thermophilum]|uniref:Small ribosomal subunit protein uS13 n=1 Tax=Methanohalarchaeum thermophilum TaxID=1903181 RepID=A0A1Q6DX75_METT1|nr:MAG: Ribosomal protein S13 [Candidatus Methanohalarchaeum thermophilum]